jgi:plastocyanin
VAVATVLVTALVGVHAAGAQQERETIEPEYGTLTIAITGDPAFGSLGFKQAVNEAVVGEQVRFANGSGTTHQVVERSGLFAFSVGPKAEVRRVLEAGQHRVYSPEYPDFMSAVIRVPPDAELKRKVVTRRNKRTKVRTRRVTRSAEVRWAVAAPEDGHSFDVERRRGRGAWQSWRAATTTTSGRFSVKAGDSWRIRVRTRTGDSAGAWSPSAPLVP